MFESEETQLRNQLSANNGNSYVWRLSASTRPPQILIRSIMAHVSVTIAYAEYCGAEYEKLAVCCVLGSPELLAR